MYQSAVDVGLDHASPQRGVGPVHGPKQHRASVGDDYVETAEHLDGPRGRCCRRVLVGDVGDRGHGAAASRLDLRDNSVETFRASSHRDDARPGVRERERGRSPDPAARAGHESRQTVEGAAHACSSTRTLASIQASTGASASSEFRS